MKTKKNMNPVRNSPNILMYNNILERTRLTALYEIKTFYENNF